MYVYCCCLSNSISMAFVLIPSFCIVFKHIKKCAMRLLFSDFASKLPIVTKYWGISNKSVLLDLSLLHVMIGIFDTLEKVNCSTMWKCKKSSLYKNTLRSKNVCKTWFKFELTLSSRQFRRNKYLTTLKFRIRMYQHYASIIWNISNSFFPSFLAFIHAFYGQLFDNKTCTRLGSPQQVFVL